MSESVLMIGASSAIARALCHRMARRRCKLVLAGRHLNELEKDAADLRIRYGSHVRVEHFDALDDESRGSLLERSGDVTGIVLCHGYLPRARSADESRKTLDTNFTSAVLVLEEAAARLEKRGAGYIVAISSVAGDRGRQSNYLYGAAKAGLSTYLAGLRNRLFRSGVHVLTVKPGFVDTPMTAGLLNPASPLVSSPERVAAAVDRAILRRRNVIYTPWFWRPVMKLIRAIPEPLFKRMGL